MEKEKQLFIFKIVSLTSASLAVSAVVLSTVFGIKTYKKQITQEYDNVLLKKRK